jgi:hypothetical protein
MAGWVTVREASEVLGVSQDTIKRRLKNGELVGRREKIPNGFKWYVQVQDAPTTVGTTVDDSSTVAGSTADTTAHSGGTSVETEAALTVLAVELQMVKEAKAAQDQELAKVWTQLEARTREVEELHVLLQRAQEQRQAPLYLPPQQQGATMAGAAVNFRKALMGSWWWKKLFAP